MKRPLYGWLAAEAVSLTGTRVSMIAIPLFVLETTGSATQTGVVALAETAPLVLTKVLGGPLIDSLGPRRVAVTCDLLSIGAIGAIPLLHHLGALSFPLLLVLVAIAGALRGPGDAAKSAMVPALVAEAGVPMERATGLSGAVERTASMLGAGLAGALVATAGADVALALDAVSFGVSALGLLWATAGLAMRPEADPDPAPYAAQLRDGWRFLRRDPLLFGIAVMVALTNLLDAAAFAVLMPVWSTEPGRGAATLGLILAVWSGCSALGAVCAAAWAARLPRFRVYLLAFLLTGLPRFLVLAFDSPLALVLGVFVVGGFASGFLNPVLGAVIFERIPTNLVGRVSSMSTAMCFALMPFGGLVGGLLVDQASLTVAFVACGVAYFAVTMLPAVDPRWREMDRRPDPAAKESALSGS